MGFTRRRRDIEPRWVSEYAVKFYSKFPVQFRCPLGPIPQELKDLYGPAKARRVYRPSRPEVDLAIKLPRSLILVEAKVFKYMNGLSKLPVYRSLVDSTPELSNYYERKVEMQLLIPHEIPWVLDAGRRMDVIVRVWAPDWVHKIWEERDKYWTRPMVEKREKRKEVLRRLGYE